MSEQKEEQAGQSSGTSGGSSSFLGCMVLLVLVVLAGVASFWIIRDRAQSQQQERAEEEFAPVLEKLQQYADEGRAQSGSSGGGSGAAPQGYDIDRTIQVIHGLDLGLREQGSSASLRNYLVEIAKVDYRGVAPEVLESRAKLLEVLKDIYAQQVQNEQQDAMWEVTTELLLTTLSTVQVGAEVEATGVGSSASFKVDREQARRALGELRESQKEKRDMVAESAALDGRLVEVLLDYSEVYYRFVEEWDRLCVLRDRAYLAAAAGEWEQAKGLAERAIEMAPQEKEAHLLRALAWVELGEGRGEGADQVSEWLERYIEENPGASAPALLLRGVHKARRGELAEAELDFEQSSSYFPRQAEQLSVNLNPYKARSFLRKTREGNRILDLYKSTMLGAGYFSPNLQLAKLAFDRGDFEGGREKVMDHFSRRRAQQQWDLILADLEFCHGLLGDSYRQIFPEDSWLDLIVKPTLMGGGLKLAINNRSPQTLHNATLVLVLHFTDMHPDDYETITAEKTEPAVLAHKVTSFGDRPIEFDLHGVIKTRDDIVQHRAILVADEAVIWVDTDEFKISEAEEFRSRRFRGGAHSQTATKQPVSAGMSALVSRVLRSLPQDTTIDIESSMLNDDVGFTLPRELAVLRPTFRLRIGDEASAPAENLIDGEQIKLRFSGKTDFDGETPPPVVLEISTLFGSVELGYAPQSDGSYALIASPSL